MTATDEAKAVNRCAILKAVHTVTLEERAVPTISDDEVLVQVMSTGICGSDIYHYNNPDAPHGMVLGHESAGRVAKVGKNVKYRQVGQKVAIEPGFLCHTCEFCRRGNSHVCSKIRYAGNDGTDGTMSQWFVCTPDMLAVMPDHIPWAVAGCVQPVAISVQVARQAEIKPHQTVAVFGCGPLGLITMAVAKSYGVSRITAFDIEPARVEFAKSYCADEAYVVPKDYGGKESFAFAGEFVKTVLADQKLPYGVDVAIEATGAEVYMQMAVFITKPHGTYLQAGFGKQLTLMPMGLMAAKSISIKGTVRYGPGTFEDAIDLLARGRIDIAPLITATYPLTKINDALKAQIAREGIKIVLMNQE